MNTRRPLTRIHVFTESMLTKFSTRPVWLLEADRRPILKKIHSAQKKKKSKTNTNSTTNRTGITIENPTVGPHLTRTPRVETAKEGTKKITGKYQGVARNWKNALMKPYLCLDRRSSRQRRFPNPNLRTAKRKMCRTLRAKAAPTPWREVRLREFLRYATETKRQRQE